MQNLLLVKNQTVHHYVITEIFHLVWRVGPSKLLLACRIQWTVQGTVATLASTNKMCWMCQTEHVHPVALFLRCFRMTFTCLKDMAHFFYTEDTAVNGVPQVQYHFTLSVDLDNKMILNASILLNTDMTASSQLFGTCLELGVESS